MTDTRELPAYERVKARFLLRTVNNIRNNSQGNEHTYEILSKSSQFPTGLTPVVQLSTHHLDSIEQILRSQSADSMRKKELDRRKQKSRQKKASPDVNMVTDLETTHEAPNNNTGVDTDELLLEMKLALNYEYRSMGEERCEALRRVEAAALGAARRRSAEEMVDSELLRVRVLQGLLDEDALTSSSSSSGGLNITRTRTNSSRDNDADDGARDEDEDGAGRGGEVPRDHFCLEDVAGILRGVQQQSRVMTCRDPAVAAELSVRASSLRTLALVLSLLRARQLLAAKTARVQRLREDLCEQGAEHSRREERLRRELGRVREEARAERAELEEELAYRDTLLDRVSELECVFEEQRKKAREASAPLQRVGPSTPRLLLSLDLGSLELAEDFSVDELAGAVGTCERSLWVLREALELRRSRRTGPETQEAPTSSLCCVCQDCPKTVLLLPCRHLCLCENCSEELRLRSCPMCREVVAEQIRVYS